jgi:diadenosine tetraphosphate (Ap4A) HIT family hydrolase
MDGNHMTSNCLMCDLENADDAKVVFRDDLWAAEIVPGYEVPGWFFLRARRHADRITGLNDAELDTFGHRARNMVAAVTQATNAEATYMLMFGENYTHFHVLITARGAQVPPDRRAGDILKLRLEQSDPARAMELLPAVRSAYADATSGSRSASATTVGRS